MPDEDRRFRPGDPSFCRFSVILRRRPAGCRHRHRVTRYIDPESGRPYEVGPDGVSRWLDEGEPPPASGRRWYRKVRYTAPGAAALGFVVAAAANGSAPAA